MNEEVMSKEAGVTFLKAVSWNLPQGNEYYEKPNAEHCKSKGYGISNPRDMGLLSAMGERILATSNLLQGI
jgi:hypothetical protein